MSDFQQILAKLSQLENRVERLESEKSLADKAVEFERLPPSATVGKDYVAYRFNCSLDSVVRGRAGTNKIRKVSEKPLKFIKREVDEVWRHLIKPVAEKVAEMRGNTKVRKRSIIKKGKI